LILSITPVVADDILALTEEEKQEGLIKSQADKKNTFEKECIFSLNGKYRI